MGLKTDYKNDILDVSMGGLRRYRQIDNGDGTVSFEDVTVYTQEGSTFGANDANLVGNSVLNSVEEVEANTDENMLLGANFGKELNDSLGGVSQFIVDESTGKITGYKTKAGADTVFPFNDVPNLQAVCGVVYYLNYPSGDYGYPILDYLTDYVTMTDYNRKYTVLKDFDALFIAELGDFSDSNTNTNCSILINDESILTITFANKKKHLSNICTISLKAGDVIEFSKNGTYIIGSVCCYIL